MFKIEEYPIRWAIATVIALELSKLILNRDYFEKSTNNMLIFLFDLSVELFIFIILAYGYRYYMLNKRKSKLS
jgi:hypothetical protein